jgi:hypothetical protein
VAYAGSWHVEASEVAKPGYLDTTIRNSVNPNVMLRVDVSPGAAKGDTLAGARLLEQRLRTAWVPPS